MRSRRRLLAVDFGLAFDSALSFSRIMERLNELGPWTWRERDSAWYFNLASARTDSLLLDLIESGPNDTGGRVDAGNGRQFAISVRCRRGHTHSPREWAALRDRIEREILPALEAERIEPTDTID